MFYVIGFEKTPGAGRKIAVARTKKKAFEKYEKIKSKNFRAVLLKYGNTAKDYIILSQYENGQELEQCRIENGEE